jgi:hypothetical protein
MSSLSWCIAPTVALNAKLHVVVSGRQQLHCCGRLLRKGKEWGFKPPDFFEHILHSLNILGRSLPLITGATIVWNCGKAFFLTVGRESSRWPNTLLQCSRSIINVNATVTVLSSTCHLLMTREDLASL